MPTILVITIVSFLGAIGGIVYLIWDYLRRRYKRYKRLTRRRQHMYRVWAKHLEEGEIMTSIKATSESMARFKFCDTYGTTYKITKTEKTY